MNDAAVDSIVTRQAVRWRTFSLIALAILVCTVFVTQLSDGMKPLYWARAAAFCIPLWLPIPGLLTHNRYTYRWATLCVLPYFVVALTEAVADSTALIWSLSMLVAALLWFASLVGYLRATRPAQP